MPEPCDQTGHFLRALQRQQMPGTGFHVDVGARIDDRVRRTLPCFAQIAVGATDDDERRQIERADCVRPVFPAATLQPGEPGLARGAFQVVDGEAVGRGRQRMADVAVDERPGRDVVERPVHRPADHLLAPVFVHRFGRGR